MHPTGGKAVARLAEAGVTVPDGWVVRQDHARRGLLLRTPVDAAEADVVAWCVRRRHRAVPGRDDRPVAGRGLPSLDGHGTAARRRRAGGARPLGGAPPRVRARADGSSRPATRRRAGRVRRLHADGGLANETVLVDLGPSHPGVVVRLPPLEPTFPDYDLAPQALVQNAVAAVGVPAPAPAVVVRRPGWIGSPFLVMPRVFGDIPGPAPVFDPYVRDAGPGLPARHARRPRRHLAAVHAVPWGPTGWAVLPRAGSCATRWTAGRPMSSGPRRATRCPRWPAPSTGAAARAGRA